MVSGRSIYFAGLFVVCASVTGSILLAQDAAGQKGAENDPSTQEQTEFAPGVVTVIPPAPDPKETFDGPLTLQTLLDGHPEIRWGGDSHPEGKPHFDPRSQMLTEMAEEVFLRREIYAFEFSFKPLRQIYIDVPRSDGRMQRKLIWYLVFRIRYRGGDLRPAADVVGGKEIFERIESVSYQSRRIFPMLVLNNRISGKRYVDRILPTAKQKIAIREQITAPLYNTVEISRAEIPQSTDPASPGVWGVATWEDVDPKLDFLSVDVFGLTNAFEQDGEGPDAPYRKKALQLNFYRPGDAVKQTEDKIRFGVPAYEKKSEQEYYLKQYGLDKRLDYQWIFR
ncbi:hypothetical protein CA13_14820 [Planctomycetes bacterium CA13]|uniref:Secreted protein n=1 Tax=Novipirellula herctigrandis TaxID=2527986 RepID=A0A5C5YY85_9BACT|nr:hypothetical protein CA13_14820 [Planctomycetes bacterium CA13]